MEKGIVKFIFEQHNRLSCIIRYNNTPKLAEESVAEHSYYVAFLVMILIDYAGEQGLKVDKEKILKMALVHDMEEIVSGDIIRVLKSGGFKAELDKMNEKSMQHLTGALSEKQSKEYFGAWKEAKEKQTTEAKILELADICSTLAYCIREIHLGNHYFKEILEYAVKLILPFSAKLPEMKNFICEFSKYCISYLKEDKKIYDDIDRAVRVFYNVENG